MSNSAYEKYIEILELSYNQLKKVVKKTASSDIYEGGRNANGNPHGFGKMAYADGSIYEGNWVNGERTGKGKEVLSNGTVYDGEWNCNKKIGKAIGKIIAYQSGSFIGDYIGEILEGKPEGNGSIKFKDSAYEGGWKDGKRNGQGIWLINNGGKYDGEWKDNKRCGQGVMKWSDGDFFEGQWKDDGKWNGSGNIGELKGEWKNGEFYSGIKLNIGDDGKTEWAEEGEFRNEELWNGEIRKDGRLFKYVKSGEWQE